MLSKEKTAEIVAKYAKGPKDTGSAPVQIALLTAEILALTEHMKQNPHDFHSQRGLLAKVGARRSLLDYLARTNRDRYLALLEELGLRK
ncbi:MAG: 30S ribosomal protein S15 [Bacilli bacterium]|jgi:small subunit ribosomal protein S15|nr:30S ribosomal protein S15 [Bacilli bacterium]MDD3388920.1 30S ribosomal protein S15 [Bacilli bacterium]MDD4344626.1 30S ribosomal protein S15 [Bacilli bacterium]MDD4520600.1 30S ribosomal protein S15 [Bacilli bacterium]MDY0399292.1 30S ribosomal protein S15 [Bacilli bacterium]